MSGVATLSESSDEAFAVGDEVVITMHVNIPDVVPVLSRLRSVMVELAGSGASHVLFENYGVTTKGTANYLVHNPQTDNTPDTTTFRLAQVALNAPAEDPVFIASGIVDPYTIYSTATVEYQTSTGRRLADVATIRSNPARRGLRTEQVDVVATNVISIDAQFETNENGQAAVLRKSSSSSTVVIISIGAFFGTAFVIAGAVFLVKNKCMQSRVQQSKVRFYPTKIHTNPMRKQGAALPMVSSSLPLSSATAPKTPEQPRVSTINAAPVAVSDATAPTAAPVRKVKKVLIRKKLRHETLSEGASAAAPQRRLKKIVRKQLKPAVTN